MASDVPPCNFSDPGLSWTQRLIEEARAGKKLLPIQEALLLKALNLTYAQLQELIWSHNIEPPKETNS
jgi:hypothetical protein